MAVVVGRRGFIATLGGAAAWPLAARAQQPERRRIGVLLPYDESNRQSQAEVTAFREALERLGWWDGRNVQIEYRWAGDDVERIRIFAKELVSLKPDVILGRATPVIAALLAETSTIPIVFAVLADPVGEGFVKSLSRPQSNVTGFTNVESSLAGKWLELLKEVAPSTTHVALIFNPKTAPGGGLYYLPLFEFAAPRFAVSATGAPVHNPYEIESAVTNIASEPGGGLVMVPDAFTIFHRQEIVSLAVRLRVPMICPYRYMIAEGGLISYGVDLLDLHRRSATYIDRILRGANPSDLPVQAPTKFELAVNLNTAKALGLVVPPSLLGIADEVVE
jgi:putative tryptophan/tyrosine transport system substrate-binding protein